MKTHIQKKWESANNFLFLEAIFLRSSFQSKLIKHASEFFLFCVMLTF